MRRQGESKKAMTRRFGGRRRKGKRGLRGPGGAAASVQQRLNSTLVIDMRGPSTAGRPTSRRSLRPMFIDRYVGQAHPHHHQAHCSSCSNPPRSSPASSSNPLLLSSSYALVDRFIFICTPLRAAQRHGSKEEAT
jgi:hypothetical protein